MKNRFIRASSTAFENINKSVPCCILYLAGYGATPISNLLLTPCFTKVSLALDPTNIAIVSFPKGADKYLSVPAILKYPSSTPSR